MNARSESPSRLVRFFDNFLQEGSIKWVLALGTLILLGSSLLLVTPQLAHVTPVWTYLVFLAYTAALFAGGEYSYHRLGLRRTGTVLLGLIVLLVPILFLVLDRGLSRSLTGFDVLFRVGLAAATLAFSVIAAGRIFRHFLRGAQPTFLASYLILALAGAVLPWLADAWQPTAALALWGVFAAGTMKVNRHVFWLAEENRRPRVLGFFPIGLLGGQFLALYVLFAAPHVEVDWLGLGCVLTAVPVLAAGDALARVFQQRTGDLVRPLPWSVLMPLGVSLCLCVVGVGLAATGMFPLHRPHAHALVFAAGIASGLLAQVARRTGKPAFAWAMLVAVTVAYQSSPAFFIDTARALLHQGAEWVHEERLPYAFYGLTYLPLLVALTGAAACLRERDPVFARPMRRFAIGLACVLLAASLGHAKAVFPVGIVITLIFAAQVAVLRRRFLAIPAMTAWTLAAVGLGRFLEGIFAIKLSADFELHCLTTAAAALGVAAGWLDPWLARLDQSATVAIRPPMGLVHIGGLALALGTTGYWFAQVLAFAIVPHATAGFALLVLLLAWGLLCRDAVIRLPALVVATWQGLAFSLTLLAPCATSLFDVPALALPLALPIAGSVLLWQIFVRRIAPPGRFFIEGHLMALRLLLVAVLASSAVDAPGLSTGGVLFGAAAFFLVGLAEGIAACQQRLEARAWCAIGFAGAGVGYLAWFHVLPLGSGLGIFATLVLALVLWLGKELADRHEALGPLSRAFAWTAFTLPLAAVGLGIYRHLALAQPPWLGANSLALLLAGAFYFWRGVEARRKELTLLAAVILNVALVLLCRELTWSDPQFFMIPIGVTILGLVQLFKEEVPERYHDPLHYAGALVILVSPVFHIGTSWLHLFTLMVASVGVVLVAIGLRVRALVYAGTAFLLADLVAMIVRGSLDNMNVLWIAGLVLGTAVLALGAACERNRETLLQRMRVVAEALHGWD